MASTDLVLRAKVNQSLTLEEMQTRLPAIFAGHAHESRSSRYVFVSTRDMLDNLMRNDFVPVEARVSRTKDESRRGFNKHMVRLRHRSDLDNYRNERRVGDTSFETILRNAHDGTGSYQFMAGLLRLVCLNGMVVSDGTLADVKVLHSGNRERQIKKVVEGAYQVLQHGPRVMDKVRSWQQLQLTKDEQMAFAEGARTLRFGDAKGNVDTPIQAQQLLHPRRYDDRGDDMWKVFNRVQENAIRGGITAMGRDANGRPRRSSSREVRGIDGDVKLNKALWMLGERMVALKTGAPVVEAIDAEFTESK